MPESELKEYRVAWYIEVEATSAIEAAQKVWKEQFNRTNTSPLDACVFDVSEHPNGEVTTIDLSEISA